VKWLTIIGMGEDGYDGLQARARLALETAEVIVGSERLLAFLPEHSRKRHEWPQPFSAVVDRITPLRGRRTVILATGDPLNYGVARKLMTFIPFAEMEIIPHLSAFSLAASRVGWSLPDCDTLTLHGRDAAHIEAFIQPDVRLWCSPKTLRQSRKSPAASPQARLRQIEMTVLENMGGPRERQSTFIADDFRLRSSRSQHARHPLHRLARRHHPVAPWRPAG
jgi:precorrin-6B C5,15-methyltransferase / cobalt-precorrin-6B C5,C15-methyltransferase